MAKADLFTCNTAFIGWLEGAEVSYRQGEVVHATDPAVAKWPAYFGPVVVRELKSAAVEMATAAPGQKRG